MSAAEVLHCWSEACRQIGLRWYLYKETLLCANGFSAFPQELNSVQVAILAKELPTVIEHVFPLLPADWELDKREFVNNKSLLSLKCDDQIMLSVDLLYGVENREEMELLSAKLKQYRASVSSKLTMCRLLSSLLGSIFGRPFRSAADKLVRKAFRELTQMAAKSGDDATFYCDSFTNKLPVLIDRDSFSETERICCGREFYPVFRNYRSYLKDTFGDYENGLTDEIGVGLTAEEKEALRFHQEKCREALAFVQELSEEFSLRYYLLAGSVLGPARHGGFIPWDDDVDIGIRIEEVERFEEIVKAELPRRLPEGFTLEQSGANNPYPRMFSKICYDGRCCIDLWPLVPTFIHGNKARFLWYFGKLITKVHYEKIGHRITQYRKLARFIGFFLNDKQVMWLARRNERTYSGKQTPAYINLYSIYKRGKETIKREWLDTPATMDFDGLKVPVVGCTELYLTHLYGNYMEKPAPWKRVSRHVARF